MKLNKPKSTEHADDLQNYISSMLLDELETVNKIDGSNVTRLRRQTIIAAKSTRDNLTDSAAENGDINPQEKLVEGCVPLEEKSTLISVEKQNQKTSTSLQRCASENSDAKLTQANLELPADQLNEPALPYINESDPRLKKVEQLLSKISLARLPEIKSEVAVGVVADSQSKIELENAQQLNQELESAPTAMLASSFVAREKYPLKKILGGVFQTLVFEVNRLTMAVPLLKLGGIIDISEQDITPLVGTPNWFMGLVPNERGNLMVVDTQQFLMPEKAIVEEKKYRYLIILDDSQWALACHSVGEAKNLTPDDIRWSARSSSRPWFAGMVVEHLSALLEVDELINLLAENIVEK